MILCVLPLLQNVHLKDFTDTEAGKQAAFWTVIWSQSLLSS